MQGVFAGAGGAVVEPTQPHCPGDESFGSFLQISSMQSGMPSVSLSVSGLPQPQALGLVLLRSFGHPSTQSTTPSPSLSPSGQRKVQEKGSRSTVAFESTWIPFANTAPRWGELSGGRRRSTVALGATMVPSSGTSM